jgi:hypothetical protein
MVDKFAYIVIQKNKEQKAKNTFDEDLDANTE